LFLFLIPYEVKNYGVMYNVMRIHSNIIRYFLLIYSIANIQINVCLDLITVILSHDSLSDNKIDYYRISRGTTCECRVIKPKSIPEILLCPIPIGTSQVRSGPIHAG